MISDNLSGIRMLKIKIISFISSIKSLVGMRTLKTGIAVIISAYLGETFLVSNPFYAVMGTILAMQNTVKNSFNMGKNRILGTLLGATIGFLFAAVATHFYSYYEIQLTNPIYIGIAIIFTIICCNALKLSGSIIIALTVCFSIIIGDSERQLVSYAILRTTDTSIGIIVSLLVNYFILQPDYLGHLTDEIEKIEFMAIDFVKKIIVSKEFNLDTIDSELTRLDAIYKNYSADRKYNRNPVSSQKLKESIEACHDIYFHAKCIAKLEQSELANLSSENQFEILKYFDKGLKGKIILEGLMEPVFEYHINQMLDQLQLLVQTVEDLTEHLEIIERTN